MRLSFRFGRKPVAVLVVAALLSGLATWAALTTSAPVGGDPATVLALLLVDLLILVLLGAVITRRIWGIWQERRQGMAGSRLHVRLVAVFSLLAVTPAVLVALFSALFFHLAVQSWFSDRVRTAVVEARSVARAYLHEHQQALKGDALAMASDLNREASRLSLDQDRFRQVVDTQAWLRELSEVLVLEGQGKVISRSGYTFSLEMEPIPETALNRARQGELVLFVSEGENRVRALLRLDGYVDTFLYVGRPIDPKVLSHVQATDEAVKAYTELEGRRFTLQLAVTLIYGVVALLLLLVAIWYGLDFANRLVKPVSALIRATARLRSGDMSVRVEEKTMVDDELDLLSRAFNRMADQLQAQRQDLVQANDQLDQRRRFTEAVLEGVSAGVIGLDQTAAIHLPNVSALGLLGVTEPSSILGQKLTDILPQLENVMEKVRRNPEKIMEDQAEIQRPGRGARTLHVRVAADRDSGGIRGYVVTFDDMSDLLSAQRKAAWADVARRIAHEIRNPLTPIQLSAERLRRKYMKEVQSDPDVFRQCTDTIIRQVEDIRRMVDEFSAFARMPRPVMKEQDVADLARQALFLQSTAHQDTDYTADIPDVSVMAVCDGPQMSQALTNLLQNAADAIGGRHEAGNGEKTLPRGTITLRLKAGNGMVTLVVEDNGRGLPEENRDRLTEPYVTTRSSGTGLGLAIVKKIMEDHNGQVVLADRPGGGAAVTLLFPVMQTGNPATGQEAAHGA
ncbi:MAG: PAS domain-containing sensor histidine kinase [Pseudomonadota bacterium]|nr:PAS domain-containing sensor histidine kinase [Pseudomonadota bacterium]